MEGNPVPLNIRLTLTLLFVTAMPILALTPPIRLTTRSDPKLAGPAPSSSREWGAIAGVESPLETSKSPIDVDNFESSKSAKTENAFRRLPPPDVSIRGTRFDQIQERLQSLGVDYFVLERADGVAAQEAAYRFHCRFQVPGSPIYLRPFEAHDADPLHAMERVLEEVEQWTARREAVGILR